MCRYNLLTQSLVHSLGSLTHSLIHWNISTSFGWWPSNTPEKLNICVVSPYFISHVCERMWVCLRAFWMRCWICRPSYSNCCLRLSSVKLMHWPERKLGRPLSAVWLGRNDQAALTSGWGKKQYWSGCALSFEPVNTDIYCDVSIIILCGQRICINPDGPGVVE